ncbi:hypothetical protein [Mycolicibacterium sarraceniae]|uniref:hypothetical protein n=1 Tax=Mycolicibacterium sarraceniae TaxID=1534348 RepID=UPI0013D67DD4|nr:hypothetical protein [Mycolicibacterium sarraceniae]
MTVLFVAGVEGQEIGVEGQEIGATCVHLRVGAKPIDGHLALAQGFGLGVVCNRGGDREKIGLGGAGVRGGVRSDRDGDPEVGRDRTTAVAQRDCRTQRPDGLRFRIVASMAIAGVVGAVEA